MTEDNHDNNDEEYGELNRSELEEDVMGDIDDTWDQMESETDLSGGLFGGSGPSVVEQLAECDDIDDEKAAALVDAGYDSPNAILDAEMQDLLDVDDIGVSAAAAAIEWAEDADSVDIQHSTAEDIEKSPEIPEVPDEVSEKARQAGESVGRAIAAIPLALLSFLGSIVTGVVGAIVGKIPKRTGIYRKMIVAGYEGIQKNTGAHVVANTIYGDGKLVPRKAEVDDDKGHVETANGEWWTTPSGLHPVRIGDAQVVTGVADDHMLVDHIGARVAECVDLGPQRRQNVSETAAGYAPASVTSPSTAVADGGLSSQSTFDDIWLDISNPEPANDGMIVSLDKHYEMHFDQGSSEEMENQETRGMLAVMDPRGNKMQSLIYVLLFAGGIGLGMFGPSLAAQLAGTAGGSGSPVPVTLAVEVMMP